MDHKIQIEEKFEKEMKIKDDESLRSELKSLLGSYDFKNIKDVD